MKPQKRISEFICLVAKQKDTRFLLLFWPNFFTWRRQNFAYRQDLAFTDFLKKRLLFPDGKSVNQNWAPSPAVPTDRVKAELRVNCFSTNAESRPPIARASTRMTVSKVGLSLSFSQEARKFAAFSKIWQLTILRLLALHFADEFANEQQISELNTYSKF